MEGKRALHRFIVDMTIPKLVWWLDLEVLCFKKLQTLLIKTILQREEGRIYSPAYFFNCLNLFLTGINPLNLCVVHVWEYWDLLQWSQQGIGDMVWGDKQVTHVLGWHSKDLVAMMAQRHCCYRRQRCPEDLR